jgi:peptidoglycan hydrolase-like protein with peptidoglycan-binding domain
MRPSIKVTLTSAAFALALFTTASPVQAAGLTTNQINSVLTLLQSFNVDTKTVDTVRAVLNGQAPPRSGENEDKKPSTAPGQVGKMVCIALYRDLGIGSRGDDVRKLQEMLKEDDDRNFTASSTGYFGSLTAEALKRFQLKNSIASTTTGTVGPLTRGFFERRCGKGLSNDNKVGTTTASSTSNHKSND